MNLWKKLLASTLVTLLLGGSYLFFVWKQRQDPGVGAQNATVSTVDKDQLVIMQQYFPAHYEDTKILAGKTVWMKNGYTIPYYPYLSSGIQFSKRVGLIPSAQQLNVKKIIQSTVPLREDDGIEHGSRQAFVVFSLPADSRQFATPIGFVQGNEEAYYCDLLFFYDNPHSIYDHWPKDVWATIDARQVKIGMSELQTRMSIGQKIQTDGSTEGDRTVNYDQNGKHWTITYKQNRAISINGKSS